MTKVKQQSADLGTKAVDQMGTIALRLAIVAIIAMGLSALGGALGIGGEPAFEALASEDSMRTELRRAS